MASFNLTPGAWVQIIAPGGSKDQEVQVTYGRVMLCFGVPDAATAPIMASSVENKTLIAPAGVEVQARATGANANVTTGNH